MLNERKYGESGMSCKNDKGGGIGKGGGVGKGGEIGKGGGVGKGGEIGKGGEVGRVVMVVRVVRYRSDEICRCGKGGNDGK
jgi:hypothetical protein|tara:strand:- start:159 stop:401 length:243 start_codon:yes stop_codon:yes gene_type:complete